MDDFLYKIFEDLPRQGVGSRDATLQAAGLMKQAPFHPVILDLGCGTGFQTLELAAFFGGKIYALDNHKPFLEILAGKAKLKNLDSRIELIHGDLLNPLFANDMFDIIWAEGSIYIAGFEKGLNIFRPFLKNGGYFALSEVCWLRENPPQELTEFWMQEYPEIKTITENTEIIKNCGYTLTSHFILPDSAWMDYYYTPLEKKINDLKATFYQDKNVLAQLVPLQEEIDIFKKYSGYYGYVFFVLQK